MDRFGIEIESLLRGLDESERAALQAGEIDAIFDHGTAAPLLLHKAQEALRQREQEFRELIEHAPDRIVRLDRDLRYCYGNPAFRELLGPSRPPVGGATSRELGLPEGVVRVLEDACRTAFATAAVQNVELEWVTEDRELYFSARLAPEQDHAGEVSTVLAIIRDVTEQRLAEAGLRASELLFRSLTECADDIILVLDRASRAKYASPSVERHLGYPFEAVKGQEVLSFVHPEDVAEIQAGLDNGMRTRGIGTPMRFRARHRDGSWRILEAVASNRFDQPGIRGLVINARDITKRAAAEEALRASEERLQRILETVTDAITIVDVDGQITYANAGAEQVLGLSRDRITGRGFDHPDWEITAVDGSEFPREDLPFSRVLATGQAAYGVEHAVRMPAGNRVVLSVNAAPIRGPSNEIAGVVAAIRNITHQKMAEESLQQRERYFRSLIEGSSDVMTILDIEGTTIYQSPSLQRVLGYSQEELVGVNPFEFVHPEDADAVRQELARAIADPSYRALPEYRFRHRDGSWRHLESTATNRLADPAIGGIVINSRDVTERRKLEDQLLQSQKLEAVGRLAGGVAHDFNNLLQVIGGNARLLALGDQAPDDAAAELNEIEQAVARAAALTQQLLTFSRRQVSQPEVLSLPDELSRISTLLRRLVGEDVEIVSLFGNDPACVAMDRSHLDQIVLNLAVNARDAMPAGGKLTISLSEASLSESQLAARGVQVAPGRYAVLSVTDTGAGIAPEALALIFEPFFTTKPQGQGTGLGLSTVYGIVQESGGFIEVESVPGEDTCFRVHLPSIAATMMPEGPALPIEADGNGELILVVDDDSKVRRVVCRMLHHFKYETLEATNGEEGIRALQARADDVSLVITDVVMPLMGGRELGEWVGEHYPEIPVIFMSGYMEDGGDALPLDQPRRIFIPKPLRQETLRSRVHTVLRDFPRAG